MLNLFLQCFLKHVSWTKNKSCSPSYILWFSYRWDVQLNSATTGMSAFQSSWTDVLKNYSLLVKKRQKKRPVTISATGLWWMQPDISCTKVMQLFLSKKKRQISVVSLGSGHAFLSLSLSRLIQHFFSSSFSSRLIQQHFLFTDSMRNSLNRQTIKCLHKERRVITSLPFRFVFFCSKLSHCFHVIGHTCVTVSKHNWRLPQSEPVWPSGKALGW